MLCQSPRTTNDRERPEEYRTDRLQPPGGRRLAPPQLRAASAVVAYEPGAHRFVGLQRGGFALRASKQARDIHAREDLSADDGERTGRSIGRLNLAKIDVKGTSITVYSDGDKDFISLTDMLKAKDGDFFISDWLRNRNTVEFIGI